MNTKASTAALDRYSREKVGAIVEKVCLFRQRREPRHPASELVEEIRRYETASDRSKASSKENPMNASPNCNKVRSNEGNFIRRTTILVGALYLLSLAAAIPSFGAPKAGTTIKNHRVDRASIKNLQRWVNSGHDAWCKDAQLVASAQLQRIAPEFSGYRFEQASLPLENESSAKTRVVYTYTSLDGNTTYRITLRRFSWLLPLAGSEKSIVWVPVRTETISR